MITAPTNGILSQANAHRSITLLPPRRGQRNQSIETDDCIIFIQTLERIIHHPAMTYLHHNPNGGKRPKGEAGKLKGMGTKPGIPDYTLFYRVNDAPGLHLEFKAPGKKQTEEQIKWERHFIDQGWRYVVVTSPEEGIEQVCLYLNIRNPLATSTRAK